MAARRRSTLAMKSDSTADYVCECGASHTLTVDPRFLRSSTPVRMRFRCPCGRRRVFYMERRAAVRKQVELDGLCTVNGDALPRPVLLRNLSRIGALLELTEDTELAVGDRLLLEFELAHREVTRFRKPAQVRRVQGREVGAEFVPPDYDRVYDMALALHHPAAPGMG